MRRQQPMIAALFTVAVWLLATAASALAISAPIHIAGTGGEGVYIRSGPSTSNSAVGWMPEGASPDYNCFVWGQNIGGVPIWFNVNYGGVTGYYASFYDDSSYHSNEELTAKYGVPLCGSTSAPAPAPGPTPATGSPGPAGTYAVVDADAGVYFRNSPHWGDTSQTPGVGVYTGDRVQVICGAVGDPVGPYANSWWSYVQNLSRPSAGKGWVNAHFIDDGAPSGSPSPGEGGCAVGTPGVTPKGSAPQSGLNSVFFSPNNDYPSGLPGIGVAFHELLERDWAEPNCGVERAARYVAGLGSNVGTLAGWSLGRMGPIFALLSPTVRANVHRVVLFDPGTAKEISNSCDGQGYVNSVLAGWLKSNSANKLEILTGEVTENRLGGEDSRPTFGGIWHYYFADIWNQPFAGQVRVCDYDHMEHADVLREFAWIVETPTSYCPSNSWSPQPVEWHP